MPHKIFDRPSGPALIAASLFALLAALLGFGRAAEAAFPGQNGNIAFERFGDVYLSAPDGSVARKIGVVGVQANPAVSPDGARVAYESGRGIWVMDADGSGQQRVSDGTNSTTFADSDPAWSTDGGRIVFSRYQAGDSDLWSANLDGTGQKNLTNTGGYDEVDPAWSPVGGEISCTRVGCDPDGGISCIFKMDPDGTDPVNLTPETRLTECLSQPGYFHRGASSEPSWSPDGTKIAFNSNRPTGNPTAVYLVGANGGAVSRLATSSGFDNDPAWGALDVAAPEVARVAPAEGTRNVLPKTNVTAAFSEAMDGGTLNGRTFSARRGPPPRSRPGWPKTPRPTGRS